MAEFFWLADASTIAGELARTGCVHPMTQAKTAIHIESAVAIPAFIVCRVERISKYIICLPKKRS